MPTKTQKPRYALYTRISKDPTGTSTAPARQEKECRALAREKGFEIVDVYTDTDLSAYREGVVRPQYEAMLEAMAQGLYDGVVIWKLDRLVRRIVEFSRFWKVATDNKVELVSKHDPIDTTNPITIGVVYLIVGLAEQESRNTSTRLKAKEREQAEAGKPKGSRRAYGMADTSWTKIDKAEAKVIREAAERCLAGETLNSIVTDLNRRGVPSATGKRWTRLTMQHLLRQARLFGWREHHGELVAKGEWPAILDEATGRRLRELIANPKAKGGTAPARKHLLSGLLVCAKCGHTLKAGNATERNLARYVCPAPRDGGCAGTTIDRGQTDEAIAEMALYRLDSPNVSALLRARKAKKGSRADDAELLAQLAEVTERTKENGAAYARGELSMQAFTAADRELEAMSRRLNEQLAAIRQAEPLAEIVGRANLRDTWHSMPVGRQRAVLDALLEKVVVHPAGSAWYDALMRETVAAEIDELEAEIVALRADAEKLAASGDQAAATKAYRRAWKVHAKAQRRRDVLAMPRLPGAGSTFRAERLEPVWKV